jgi:hypothetical protein
VQRYESVCEEYIYMSTSYRPTRPTKCNAHMITRVIHIGLHGVLHLVLHRYFTETILKPAENNRIQQNLFSYFIGVVSMYFFRGSDNQKKNLRKMLKKILQNTVNYCNLLKAQAKHTEIVYKLTIFVLLLLC